MDACSDHGRLILSRLTAWHPVFAYRLFERCLLASANGLPLLVWACFDGTLQLANWLYKNTNVTHPAYGHM